MTTPQKTKGLRIATRCTTVEQFVAAFQRFCDEQSFFISTLATRPVGLETAFSVDLVGGAPALRGLGIVLDSWTTAQNPFGRPGVHLGIRRLTADSERVFEKLLIAKAVQLSAPEGSRAPPRPPVTPAPRPKLVTPPAAPVVAKPLIPALPPLPPIDRTPGSELVLPANPLMGITDESLEGFVDCTIFEETGNFFPIDTPPPEDSADPVVQPPMFAPITSARPIVQPPLALAAVEPAPPEPSPPRFVSAPIQYPLAPPLEYPLATPPFATGALAPESAPMPRRVPTVKRPIARDPRRWYILGGLAVIVIATIAIVFAKSSAASQPSPAAPAKAPLAIETPHVVPALQARAVETHPAEPEQPQVAGMPVVGNGPCRIIVAATPAGSTIQLDGRTYGPSPLTIDGPCQRRQLSVSHPRYQSSSRAVAPIAGKPNTIEVVLDRPTHALMVETAPLGATISIGGRRAGTSPTIVELMGYSTIAITISKPGFAPVTKRIYSKKPNDRLFVRLTKQ